MHDGSSRSIPLHQTFRPHYRDEYTNEHIPQELVLDAIKDKLDDANDKVWTAVPIAEALQHDDAKVIGTGWVICNKQDHTNPDVRARLVAQESNVHSDTWLFM